MEPKMPHKPELPEKPYVILADDDDDGLRARPDMEVRKVSRDEIDADEVGEWLPSAEAAHLYEVMISDASTGYIAMREYDDGKWMIEWRRDIRGGSFVHMGDRQSCVKVGIQHLLKGTSAYRTGPAFVGDKAI
jgi:hypothetical protein